MASISAAESLQFVTNSVPELIRQLDDLTQQILQRHSDLREFSVRQLKKRTGSTVSCWMDLKALAILLLCVRGAEMSTGISASAHRRRGR